MLNLHTKSYGLSLISIDRLCVVISKSALQWIPLSFINLVKCPSRLFKKKAICSSTFRYPPIAISSRQSRNATEISNKTRHVGGI